MQDDPMAKPDVVPLVTVSAADGWHETHAVPVAAPPGWVEHLRGGLRQAEAGEIAGVEAVVAAFAPGQDRLGDRPFPCSPVLRGGAD